jgi:hypothetical protein
MLEMFYLDTESRSLFSILITDYLLLDEALQRNPEVQTSYSDEAAEFLATMIQRLEENDPTIVKIPRLTSADWDEIRAESLKPLFARPDREQLKCNFSGFLSESRRDLTCLVQNIEDKSLADEVSARILARIDETLDRFLNEHGIDEAASTVVEVPDCGSISIDLRNLRDE